MIDYNNLIFEIDDTVTDRYDFLKNVGTLYDLLINLLDKNETTLDSSSMQIDLTKIMLALKSYISEKIENITDKSKKQKKEIFAAQSSVLINLSKLIKKRGHIIYQFNKGNIITEGEKFFDPSKKITESVTEEKSKKESHLSIPIWVKVSEKRFNSIKQIINENKDLGTTINNKRYTLNDANNLVNEIAEKKGGKNKAINFYNNLVNKAEQISKLRSSSPRQNMLEIFNYLREIFNGPETDDEQLDTIGIPDLESAAQRRNQEGKGLKILTSNQVLSRLPISLAQLKAENNSEKLKNEIRQLLYSMYGSKKLTKQIYKCLIDII